MKLSAQFKLQKGFTLIELLVVIGILAVLLAITLIAINPARQFAQANNTQRASDINAILNAINQYMADNSGTLPVTIPATDTNIGSGGTDVNPCSVLVPTYIAAMPFDPTASTAGYTNCTTYNTQYSIRQSTTNNRITVTAPNTETPPATADLFVTR